MDREAFLARFGGVWENSPWIAEATFDAGLGEAQDTAEGLHQAMVRVMRGASRDKQQHLILAHPDLAGKLATARMLTVESTSEQASAGLDAMTLTEKERFDALNQAYRQRFGFPFIIAVRGKTRAAIVQAFETRLGNTVEAEFAEALRQIERITRLRLEDLLG